MPRWSLSRPQSVNWCLICEEKKPHIASKTCLKSPTKCQLWKRLLTQKWPQSHRAPRSTSARRARVRTWEHKGTGGGQLDLFWLKNCQYFQLCTLVSLSLLFVLRYFPNALLARVPQLSYDNLDYDGEPGIEFGPRRTVEWVFGCDLTKDTFLGYHMIFLASTVYVLMIFCKIYFFAVTAALCAPLLLHIPRLQDHQRWGQSFFSLSDLFFSVVMRGTTSFKKINLTFFRSGGMYISTAITYQTHIEAGQGRGRSDDMMIFLL